MRTKEDAHDYRYFTCPDLLPIRTAPLLEKVRHPVEIYHSDISPNSCQSWSSWGMGAMMFTVSFFTGCSKRSERYGKAPKRRPK